jgi:cytochrome c oxidase subunit II
MTARRPWAIALALAGCSGPQAALDAAGPQAGRIGALWWIFLSVCVVVMVAVTAALAIAVVRGRAGAPGNSALAPLDIDAAGERRAGVVVAIAVGLTAVVLIGLLTASVLTGRAISALGVPEPAVTIEVVGHQWWWEIRYRDAVPAREVLTANEIHIPVGQPVKITLTSRDVIHSFWVPPLHGKRDLIPGQRADTWIQADRPGVYEGQCAEFCGMQHARMRLKVFAEEPAHFAAWLEGQRAPAPEPQTALLRRGRDVFVGGPCALCHSVLGTDARGKVAPDLTHIASRTTLAAGTLPNTPGHLAGWIIDPQSVKPGTRMPANSLDAESLQALLGWLGSLK